MIKKLLFLSAFFMVCVCNMSAQTKWYVVADGKTSVAVEDVAYMLFSDGSEEFAIVKNDNSSVYPVLEVTFSQNANSAIENVGAAAFDLSVFPNPVVNELNLRGLRENAKAQIFTVGGALVMEAELTPENGRVDVSGLSAGIYVLQVNKTTVKFVKK